MRAPTIIPALVALPLFAALAAAQVPASLPFYDGFEDASLGPNWAFWTSNYGQAVLSTSESPPVGQQHLLIDTKIDGIYSEVWVTLAVNLAGASGVTLEFLHRGFDDEDNGEDGIWISQNGTHFFPALPLNTATGTSTNTYQLHQVDLDAAAASHGLTFADPFYIRLRWVDNFGLPGDGFGFDEVRVEAPDCNGNGVPDFQDIALGTSPDCNGNAIPDECDVANDPLADIDGDGQLDECVAPPLMADGYGLSLIAGGTQAFALEAGAAHAGSPYLLMGSLTGTTGGLTLDGLYLPLSVDTYWLYTLVTPNAPPLSGSFGLLDAAGQASASFNLPPAANPGLAGATANHAFLAVDATGPGFFVSFISNPVPLAFLP